MSDLWSDTVSGSGSASIGNVQITHVLIDVLDIGTLTRRLELNDPDHILRFGWIAFGTIEDPFGEPRHYWHAPIWIDFEHMFWAPVPAYSSDGDQTIWAQEVRWSINPGGSAFVNIWGFS